MYATLTHPTNVWPVNNCDEHVVCERLKVANRIGHDRLLLRNAGRQQRQSRREGERRQKLFLSVFLLKLLKKEDQFHSDLKKVVIFLVIVKNLKSYRVNSISDELSVNFLLENIVTMNLRKPSLHRWPLSSCSNWEECEAMSDWLKTEIYFLSNR